MPPEHRAGLFIWILFWVVGPAGLACSSGQGPAGQTGGGGAPAGSGGGGGTGGAGGSEVTPIAWTTGVPCPVARFEASGAVVGGELWVLGGFTSTGLEVTRRVDLYDPEMDRWRPGPDLPGAETHMAVVTVDSDIIVAGGFAGAFWPRPAPTAAVWRYDAAASSWTAGPPLPSAGAGFAWALLGTRLHVAGGLGPDGDSDADVHYVWDVTGAASWGTAAAFPNPRNHGGGAAAGGLFYAVAGRYRWDEEAGSVADVSAFDAASGAWTPRAPIPIARSEIGASTSTLGDGRILVVGGSMRGIVPSDHVFVYDPASDVWSALTPIPAPRKGAVAFQVGRRIVVTTGSPTSTDPSATTFVGCCL